MTPNEEVPEGLIWATRGRSWGFRFLLDGGLPDPLPVYEDAIAHLGDAPLAWHYSGRSGALRFPDPDGRRDASGRIIPHEFVVPGGSASTVKSAAEGRELVWHLVSAAYDTIWASDAPPSAADVHLGG